MSLSDEVNVLRRIPLFAGIEPARLKLLAFSSERVSFQPNDTLCSQGEAADDAFVIINGEAEVLVDIDGHAVVVATLQRNALVGEMSILCDSGRTATVRAINTVDVLKITKDVFVRLIGESPAMAIEIMRLLAQRLQDTTHELTRARSQLNQLKGIE